VLDIYPGSGSLPAFVVTVADEYSIVWEFLLHHSPVEGCVLFLLLAIRYKVPINIIDV
jgi:hypothetical protein